MDDELDRLLARARVGDREARDAAVAANLNLVRHVARRFRVPGLDEEDLFQVGCVGLVKAVDRFDPSCGTQFSTYAVPLIIGEIRTFLRSDGPVKLGRAAKRAAGEARRRQAGLRQTLGREPSLGELAASLGMEQADLAAILDAASGPVSLQETVGDGEAAATLEDRIGGEDPWEERVALRGAIAALPPLQRRVIELRYFLDRTQQEAAGLLGITQVQVSRLERRAVVRLRELLG